HVFTACQGGQNMDNGGRGADTTLRAARAFTRRSLLRQTAALGTVAALAPAVISRKALSSSGELNIMLWSDYLPPDFIARFKKETGIELKHTPYGSNEELLNKIRATKGRGFDI